MKAKIKEKIMKGFLMLFLCVCFVGLTETSQANEQEYREACDGGNLLRCNRLGRLELKAEATLKKLRSFIENPVMGEILMDVMVLGVWSLKEAIIVKHQLLTKNPVI